MKAKTQKQRTLEYLQAGNVLTRLDGWSVLGILELPARICELKQDGHAIKTNRVTVFNRFNEPVSVAQWRLK